MRNIVHRGVALLIGLSCWVGSALAQPAGKPEFPFKVGVLADSQITTKEGAYNYGMRRQYADLFASVAIRPAAVEYLAPLMLDGFLLRLEAEKVDFMLYLGDGANSGCKDELDAVFAVLKKSRDRSGIPSYYVIGNHDYLGTGNQTKMSIRQNLCNQDGNANPAETKAQVMQRISRHNQESSKLDRNLSYAEKLVISPTLGTCPGDDSGQYTTYQVGVLSGKDKSGPAVEVLLTDTSDYRDVLFKPVISGSESLCEIVGVWGTKGSMSYKSLEDGSQIKNLKDMSDPKADFRLVASHYRPANLNALIPFDYSISLVRDALFDLLSQGDNVWVSGHTHTEKPKVEQFSVGKTLSSSKGKFDGINVGSTTDYDPHVLVLSDKAIPGTTRIGKTSLGFRVLAYESTPRDAVCAAVLREAKAAEASLEKICGKRDFMVTLGLDKTYQRKCWDGRSAVVARGNIDRLAPALAEKLAVQSDKVKACLAYVATSAEGKKKPRQPVKTVWPQGEKI